MVGTDTPAASAMSATAVPAPGSVASDRFRAAEQALLARYGLSASARYVALSDPDLRVRVLEAGDGPPTLLVHGLGAVAATWVPLMAELTGLRLIAVDR